MAQPVPQPPQAPRQDHVQVWHEEKVTDPWFWLREKDSKPVLDYLRAENAYTEAMTRDLRPFTETLFKEMLGRLKQTDLDVPSRKGAWFYYARTLEGQQYPIYCRRKATAGLRYDEKAPEEILLDQNELAKGKAFLNLDAREVSEDGKALLFTSDDVGFRQYKLYRKHLATGRVEGPLAERVTSVEWAGDNATVFFTTEHPVTKRSDRLWRLKPEGKAELLFEEQDELFGIALDHTKDRKFLILQSESTDTWESRILEAAKPDSAFQIVLPREKGHKYELEHRDGLLYLRTNKGAKNFRLVSASISDPSPAHWRPLVEHRPGVLLKGMDVFRNFLVVEERAEGLERFRILDFKSQTWQTVPFSEPAYAASSGSNPEYATTAFRYTYQSLVTPASIYDLEMSTGQASLLKREEVLGGYDPADYVTERLWAPARDGVKVPLSLVYRKGRLKDGKGPLWLWGYGSYGLGRPTLFSGGRLSLLDRGVVFAIAHIRGGDELGETWHDDGMLLKKKNTFFDFIDSAEYLVKEQWTTKDRLMIEGGSAGGLLMGAVANLRPDLFKAVHSAVPFVDVMNTMLDASLPLTVGEYLEWGNPNEKPYFDYMRSYSPYDNLEKKAYPAMLVTTSYHDSQVMYWEPAKYVAKLRTLKTDANELLLKCKLEPAGHGGASGRYDALWDKAFEMAWMLKQVGIAK